MKTLFVLLLLPLVARAEKSRFTTVFLDDDDTVYVGVRHGGENGRSEIVTFPFSGGGRTSIPLPAEVTSREIIGVINEKAKMFVITTRPGAQDDGPTLNVYDRSHNKWSKVGHVVCPVFTKVTLKPTQLIFSCEEGRTKKGKTRMGRKVIALKHDRIYHRSGYLIFPEFMLHFKGRTIMLEGEAPSWDTLRLRSENGERTISADGLTQLPLPPALLPDQTPLVK